MKAPPDIFLWYKDEGKAVLSHHHSSRLSSFDQFDLFPHETENTRCWNESGRASKDVRRCLSLHSSNWQPINDVAALNTKLLVYCDMQASLRR